MLASAMKDTNYRRILFAVDAEGHSRAAAPAVARLAAAADAEVVVLHVQSVAFFPRFGRWEPETRAEAERLVEGVAAELRAAGVTAITEVRMAERSRVANEIADAAAAHEADLVAVGSRGLSDLSGFVLGSVSHRVVKMLDCPVLVCRGGGSLGKGPINRILVAVAGGEEMEGALGAAADLAHLTGAEVLVLHVDFVFSGDAAVYSESEDEGQALVDRALAMLGSAGVKAMGWSVAAGTEIARDIADTAAAWNTDLIVVGSRRHSDFAAMFAGSVDHDVIHFSEKPVLIAGRPSGR
jgi:nucleotide-binding universal stress UspA family protein